MHRLIIGLLIALAAPASADPPPHIVIFLADDLGWNDVGYHGSEIRTPQIDRLAAEGIRFDAFYTQPVCMPTRAALLTGRYPVRYGMTDGNGYTPGEPGLDRTAVLLPQLLAERGYRTAILGKWHLGEVAPYRPQDRGFAYQWGGYLGGLDYFSHRRRDKPALFRNGNPIEQDGYLTDLTAAEAETVIAGHDPGTPLLLYVAFNAPHEPLQAPPGEIARYASIEDEARRTYAAMVTSMDAAIGRIRAALVRREMATNTLIVFLSDNGGSRRYGADNEPWSGGKASLREGGVRVPAVIHWPGTLRAGRTNAPAHVVDLLPTLLRRAGAAALPADLDGRDLWPVLTGADPLDRETILLARGRRSSALRSGDWKVIIRHGRTEEVRLYNLAADPTEENDRSAAEPERVAALRNLLSSYEIPPQPTGVQKRRRRGG